jgi:hypothetical protein
MDDAQSEVEIMAGLSHDMQVACTFHDNAAADRVYAHFLSVLEPGAVNFIKRERKRRPIYECRCNERLKVKAEGSTRLTYTGLRGGMERQK